MSFASKALDIFLPPLCLSCDRQVSGHGTLCPGCWSAIRFISAPICLCCGAPFDTDAEGEAKICMTCLIHPPVYRAARAAMLYDENSKSMILNFKHGDRTHMAETMAGWMHRAGASLWKEIDLIMPVPLHHWRLFKRRYNQSGLLAQHLGALAGKMFVVDGLLRPKATQAQGHLNREQREANVKGAFIVNPRSADFIQERRILLIDDVLTTGATLNECSRVLLDAGVASVSVLTLARVPSAI